MQVYGPSHLHGPQTIHAPHAVRTTAAPGAPAFSMCDELQISDAGRLSQEACCLNEQVEALVEQAKQLPDLRFERVNALRAQIAGGTYETAGKLSVALDHLLNEIG